MEDFNKIIEQFRFADLAEKSIKEFSNWLFGISIGICSLLIVDLSSSDIQTSCIDKKLYFIAIIISLINCLYVGYCKYRIFQRDIKISTIQGALNKKLTFGKINNQKASDLKPEFEKEFSEWVKEYNEITEIGKLMNWSIYLILITLITSAAFILYVKI
jgi:hypothetical protein